MSSAHSTNCQGASTTNQNVTMHCQINCTRNFSWLAINAISYGMWDLNIIFWNKVMKLLIDSLWDITSNSDMSLCFFETIQRGEPRGRSLVIIIRNLRVHWAAISHESNLENACLLADINHDTKCLNPWCLHQALLIQKMSTFFDVLQYFSKAFNLGMEK